MATNGKRDLGIVRIDAILIARPIRSIPTLMGMMSEFIRKKRWG
jgi:hypothetical protein